MEFNLNLSTSISDIISYFQGNNNVSGEFEEGIFDDVLNKSFCDSDESEDMDYNLILNLLNNLKLFDNQESFEDKGKVYTELEPVDSEKFSQLESSSTIDKFNLIRNNILDNIYTNINEVSFNIETNDEYDEPKLLSSEEFEILNKLKNNFKNESEILSNNIEKNELSDKKITVLKKFNDIIHESKIEKPYELFENNKLDNFKLDIDKNKFKSNLANNEKFSQLENSNTMGKLNLIRSDNLKKLDKDLDTLESIVSVDDNNFMLNNNQINNRDINLINTNSTKDITTIRQDYIEEDIVEAVEYLKSNSKETITIKISPKELGDMTIKLINDKDDSSVVIAISKSDVFDLVNDNQNEIVKHLKDLNINIKEISIEMKNNTENNFSSDLNQEFARHNQESKDGNRKNSSLIDEEIDDVEEFYVEENINILI